MVLNFIEKYGRQIVLLLVLGVLVAIGLHIYNPFKGLFDLGEKPVPVEQTKEYKQIEADKQAAIVAGQKDREQAMYYKGLYDQQKADYQAYMNQLPGVQQKYQKTVKQVKSMKPEEINVNYQREVQEQEKELKESGNGTTW